MAIEDYSLDGKPLLYKNPEFEHSGFKGEISAYLLACINAGEYEQRAYSKMDVLCFPCPPSTSAQWMFADSVMDWVIKDKEGKLHSLEHGEQIREVTIDRNKRGYIFSFLFSLPITKATDQHVISKQLAGHES
jgi:hypothetical protein